MRSHQVTIYVAAGSHYISYFTSEKTPETAESLANLDNIREACADFSAAGTFFIRQTNRDLSKSEVYCNPALVCAVDIKTYDEEESPDEDLVEPTPDFRDDRPGRRRR